LYHAKSNTRWVLKWNERRVFFHTNQNQFSLLVPSNQLLLLSLSFMVFGFNISTKKVAICTIDLVISFVSHFLCFVGFEMWWILSFPFF
jgi:hypothetical protein